MTQGVHMSGSFFTALWMSLLVGCADLPDASEPPNQAELKEFPEAPGESLMRMELADIHGTLPQAGYQDLLAQGEVVHLGTSQGTDQLDARLRRLLLATVEYRQDQLGDAEVQVQRIKVNRDFAPLRLLGQQVRSILPFRIFGQAEIEFARLMWPDDEASARRFTLLDVPYDAESALRLPENTIVTIPVEASIALDVAGNFLTRNAGRSTELHAHLTASAFGYTSSVRRGSLLATGRFRIQVIRGEGDRVRLRLMSGGSSTIRGHLGTAGSARARYTFLPAGRLDQIRAFKRRMDRLRRQVRRASDAHENLTVLRERAPALLKGIFDANPWPDATARTAWEDRALSTTDTALAHAQRLTMTIESLDRRFGERVDAHFNAVDTLWNGRIEPVIARIQRLSNRSYSFNMGVDLSDELVRDLKLLADYEFDLSSSEASIAFERVLSGRTVLRGTRDVLVNWGLGDLTFADFTLADTLATDYQGMDSPPVRRIATGGSDHRQRNYSMSVRGLGMFVGLDGWFQNNRIQLKDEAGQQTEWLNRAWERGQRTRFFGVARSESFASGAFTETVDDDLNRGGYWFRWKKEYGPNAEAPLADALLHATNDLGPLAIQLGLGQQYAGEYPGQVNAELFFVLNGDALERLFDGEETTDRLLWSTLEAMMKRYRRPFSLPYAHAPIRPAQTREHDYIRDGCEALAERLGGRYCYSFIDRIFPALRRAQETGSSADRLAFFESFYRVPAGGSVLSTGFLVRYLSELMYALDQTDGVSIELKLSNTQDDSQSASPIFRVGDPEALALGEATILDGLLHP